MPVQLLLAAPLAVSLWTHPRWPASLPRLQPDAPDVEDTLFDLLDAACQPDVRWRVVHAERPAIELRRGDRSALWTAERLTDAVARALLSRWDRVSERAGDWPAAGPLGVDVRAYPAATAAELRRRGVPVSATLTAIAGRHGQTRWQAVLSEGAWRHTETAMTEIGVAALASRVLLDRYADVLAGSRLTEGRLAA